MNVSGVSEKYGYHGTASTPIYPNILGKSDFFILGLRGLLGCLGVFFKVRILGLRALALRLESLVRVSMRSCFKSSCATRSRGALPALCECESRDPKPEAGHDASRDGSMVLAFVRGSGEPRVHVLRVVVGCSLLLSHSFPSR